MIIEFSVQNHRSIRAEQRLSFVASNYDKSLPDNIISLELPGLGELKLVKAIALYGPNAGGKSNVFSALQFLRWLVVESASGQKPDAKLLTAPFGLDEVSRTQPTLLTLTFIVENTRYELAVACTSQRIVQERLVAYPTGKAQVWYDRVWNEDQKKYDWERPKSANFEFNEAFIQPTRDNSLFLSTAAQWNDPKIKPLYQWFATKFLLFSLGAQEVFPHDVSARLVSESSETRRLFAKLMQAADLGMTDVEARQEVIEGEAGQVMAMFRQLMQAAGAPNGLVPERIWQVKFQHQGEQGKQFPLDWSDQSAGTRRYFSLLGPWIAAVGASFSFCVDELETSLHPLLAIELIRLAMQTPAGQPPAQLFFTTHNPLLLDQTVLRRDQVWFADKDDAGATSLYPLTDYKPRADESLVRGYLSGRYGAVPFIPHGLLGEPRAAEKPPEAAHAG